MMFRDSSQQWPPLFLLACVLLFCAPAISHPLHGKYEALLRNDSSRKEESEGSIVDAHYVDAMGSSILPDDKSDDLLSAQYAVTGTAHDFGYEMNVDAGHRDQSSFGRSTLNLSTQDYITIIDQYGAPVPFGNRPYQESLVFHISFSGSLHFEISDSLLADQGTRSLVAGEVQLNFSPMIPGSIGWRELVVVAGNSADELPTDRDHTLDLRQYLTPAVLDYPLASSYFHYQWRFYARTMATSGAISIDAPDFFKINAITFRDGTTPESHGYSLRFLSGLPSPNLRVPEPSGTMLLIGGLLVTCTSYCRRVLHRLRYAKKSAAGANLPRPICVEFFPIADDLRVVGPTQL